MEEKEAIERIKARFDKWALDDEDMKAIQTLIPELTESEDEKIRKWLIAELKDDYFTDYTPDETKAKAEKVIAWLEKQKEASKAIEAVERIDKYIDLNLANAHDMKDSNPDKKYYRGWDDALAAMSGILQDVYSGEKQKDLTTENIYKHSRERMSFYNGQQKEQKPFSSYDMAKCFIEGQDYVIRHPEKFGLQKPSSWSDEDEKMLKCCLIAINHYEKTCNIGDHLPTKFNIYGYLASVDKVKSWLKSLRPSWKPSEEQMKALEECGECKRCIKELYEDIKKRYGTC